MAGIKFAVAAVAAAVLAGPALASDAGQALETPVLKRVQFADLNLESDAGRSELDRRLQRAVRSMCAINGMPSSSALDEAQASCAADASAGLDAQVDAAVRANRARTTRMASAGN